MKSVLITGGAGYIGSHVAHILAQQKYHIVILDTFIHQQIFNPLNSTIIKADFADQKMLEHIFKNYSIEAVIHCAASIEVGLSVKDPGLFYENNVSKTITLLQTMLAHNIKKIIFSSSCAVYGNPQWLPLTEDHPKNPVSPYGKTKLMIEMILQDFNAAYDLQFVALRYFNAAGALSEMHLGEQHQPETHIIPLLLQSALQNTIFTIYGNNYQTHDGTTIRDYLHVIDIAQAHYNALNHLLEKKESGFFNLGTGKGISTGDMIKITEKILQKKIKIQNCSRRAGDAPILIADPSLGKKILKWEPKYSDINYILQTAHNFFCTLQTNKKTSVKIKRQGCI